MNADERDRLFAAIKRVALSLLPDAWAIYVYGSVARGDDHPGSDLDVAVLLPPGEKIEDILSLMNQLALLAKREVDVVDLRQSGDILRREVLADGIALHLGRPAEVLAWEAQAMSRYAQHRESISGIMEDFRRSGIGYAQ